MPERFRCVLLFGPPGVGKGTQGRILGRVPGFFHMASGDMFRAVDADSELGRKFMEFSSKGLLVPDDLTVECWREYMDKQIASGNYDSERDILLLDGIPRSVQQIRLMDDYISVLRVVHLATPDIDLMVKRMKRRAEKENRHDDADESVIRKRFEVYKQETAPLLAIFEPNIVVEIKATAAPVEVLRNILDALTPVYTESFKNPLE